MKLCKDCNYFDQELVTYGDCTHETNHKINYVTGGTIVRFLTQDMRELTNMCGPNAWYFEEATK